jgi:DNA-binding transcriptional regulator YhcF (GntR family)
MALISSDQLFEAAARILLFDEGCVTISFSSGNAVIRFPTTRKLAKKLEIPHYYVLPVFDQLEQEGLIIRVERVGIATTNAGSFRVLNMMQQKYRKIAQEVIGPAVFKELLVLTGADASS